MDDDSLRIQECEHMLLAAEEEEARVLSFHMQVASEPAVGAGGVRAAAPLPAASRAETEPAGLSPRHGSPVRRRYRSKTAPLTRNFNPLSPEEVLEASINLVSECISSFELRGTALQEQVAGGTHASSLPVSQSSTPCAATVWVLRKDVFVKELSRHTAGLALCRADLDVGEAASVSFIVRHSPGPGQSQPSESEKLRRDGEAFCVRIALRDCTQLLSNMASSWNDRLCVTCTCDVLVVGGGEASNQILCRHVRAALALLYGAMGPTARGRDMELVLRRLGTVTVQESWRDAASVYSSGRLHHARGDDRCDERHNRDGAVSGDGGEDRDSACCDTRDSTCLLRKRWTIEGKTGSFLFIIRGPPHPLGTRIVPVECRCGAVNRNEITIKSSACFSCRTSSSVRGDCEHQRKAKQALYGLFENNSVNRPPLSDSVASPDDHHRHDGEVYSGNENVEDGQSESETFGFMQNAFTSWRRRPLLACYSDAARIAHRLLHVAKGNTIHLRDSRGSCLNCEFSGPVPTKQFYEPREALLDTQQGATGVWVRDWECPSCEVLQRYEGYDDAVVAVTKMKLVCRGLLDKFLEDVFGDGYTFRDAYANFARNLKGLATGARRKHRLSDRRALSSAFAVHTSLIGGPPHNLRDLGLLMQCSNCCDVDGRPQQLVIDGTTAATSVKQLPNYKRRITYVQGLNSSVSATSFTIRSSCTREAVRFLCKIAASEQRLALREDGKEINQFDVSVRLGKHSTAAKVRYLLICFPSSSLYFVH